MYECLWCNQEYNLYNKNGLCPECEAIHQEKMDTVIKDRRCWMCHDEFYGKENECPYCTKSERKSSFILITDDRRFHTALTMICAGRIPS